MGARLKHGAATMIDHTPSSAVEAGGSVELGTGIHGIAHSPIAANELGAVSWPNGAAVYEMDKGTVTDVFAVGDIVEITQGNTAALTTAEVDAGGDADFGRCVKASASGETTVLVVNSVAV